MWRVCVEDHRSAAGHMACDVQLAQQAVPTVRLFTWNPSAISLGFKQPTPSWWDAEAWRQAGLECVERPTGGGIAVHGSDVSISIVMPREWGWSIEAMMGQVCSRAIELCESYSVQAEALMDAPSSGRIAYCLTETSPYAIMVGGRKVAGFALRRYPQSWLIQGSLLVNDVPAELLKRLPAAIATQLYERAVSLSEATGQELSESDVAQRWLEVWSMASAQCVAV